MRKRLNLKKKTPAIRMRDRQRRLSEDVDERRLFFEVEFVNQDGRNFASESITQAIEFVEGDTGIATSFRGF